VEICINGDWGTVCNNKFWSVPEAQVVCNQLGYSTSTPTGYSNAFFGPGNGSIHLENVLCTGRELFLLDCAYDFISRIHECSHSDDVGVLCLDVPVTTPPADNLGGVIGITLGMIVGSCGGLCSIIVIIFMIVRQLTKRRNRQSTNQGPEYHPLSEKPVNTELHYSETDKLPNDSNHLSHNMSGYNDHQPTTTDGEQSIDYNHSQSNCPQGAAPPSYSDLFMR
jgi:deleted-in-malignant-brain-tumors protein 1